MQRNAVRILETVIPSTVETFCTKRLRCESCMFVARDHYGCDGRSRSRWTLYIQLAIRAEPALKQVETGVHYDFRLLCCRSSSRDFHCSIVPRHQRQAAASRAPTGVVSCIQLNVHLEISGVYLTCVFFQGHTTRGSLDKQRQSARESKVRGGV